MPKALRSSLVIVLGTNSDMESDVVEAMAGHCRQAAVVTILLICPRV